MTFKGCEKGPFEAIDNNANPWSHRVYNTNQYHAMSKQISGQTLKGQIGRYDHFYLNKFRLVGHFERQISQQHHKTMKFN